MSEHPSRRSFLRSAAIVPALAVPALVVAREMAPRLGCRSGKHHFAEFANAMDELAIGANGGWIIAGGRRKAYRYLEASSWALPHLIHYEIDADPRFSEPFVIDRHSDLPTLFLIT